MIDLASLEAVTAMLAASVEPAAEMPSVQVLVQRLPERFMALTRPVTVSGAVAGFVPQDGTLTLRTAAGVMSFNLPPSSAPEGSAIAQQLAELLQGNKPLTLIIPPGTPPQQALLLLPALPDTAKPKTDNTPPLGKVTVDVAPKALLTPGAVFTAVVLPKALPSFAPPFAPSLIPPTPSDKEPSAPLPSSLPAIPSAPNPMTPQRAGATVTLRLETVLPPEAPEPFPDVPEQITATVLHKSEDGGMLLSGGERVLYVRPDVARALPEGSRLRLTLLPVETETSSPAPPESGSLPLLMATLQKLDPALPQHVMHARMPHTQANLPAALLFTLQALMRGDVGEWLGEAAVTRLEKAGQRERIAAFAEEWLPRETAAQDDMVGLWRCWPFPLQDQGAWHSLRLYVHQEREPGSPERPRATRFLISMDLSRLGAMQMDGLAQARCLDLVLRSERELPSALPNELQTIYTTTLEALGLQGRLRFQTGRQHWLVLREAKGRTEVVT